MYNKKFYAHGQFFDNIEMNQQEHDALVKKILDENKEYIEFSQNLNLSIFHSPIRSYFDRLGRAIDYVTYSVLFQNPEYQHVKKDVVDGFLISTVWLGLNHNNFNKTPIIFETMIFKGDDNPFEEYQERYATEDEALIGHEKAIEIVKKMKMNI